MRSALIISLCLVLTLGACKKEEPDLTPVITFIGIAPISLVQYSESIYITISYSDLDGDLGFESIDLYALQVRDNRLTNPDWYHVAPLAPLESGVAISGSLSIKINSLFLLGNGTQELTSFSIKMVDRAGNWSEEITTSQITILK